MINFDTDELRFKALQRSHYCQQFKTDKFIDIIELESFNNEEIKRAVKVSVNLINISYKPWIFEIIDVMNNHKDDFLLNNQKYISFYWSGVPVLLLTLNTDVAHDKQLHLSLQTYKNEKNKLINDEHCNFYYKLAIGASITLGVILVGTSVYKHILNR